MSSGPTQFRPDITAPADVDADLGALSSITSLLPFQRHIIHSLIPESSSQVESNGSSAANDTADPDALVVLARGLGLRTIVASVLRLYDGPRHLVVLVNASAEEEKGLGEELTTMGVRKPGLRSVGHEVNAKARQELYLSGGILSVTSRILVVDMLNNTIPTDLISGLIILHAERVTPTCVESFIARIYRQENKDGFLKAFSDEPEHFAIGLSPLQTVLGQLQARRVELWPRFHKSIIRDLGQKRADVIELHQPLTRSMRNIQNAIVECLDATLGELKRGSGAVDIDDCTVENAIFRAFESIVRRQLDPVWHRLGPKTKQLVNDLRTLRSLLTYLITYDAVTFHSFLETILASQSNPNNSSGVVRQNQSPWLFMDAANVIFTEAKARAFVGEVKKPQDDHPQSTRDDDINPDEEEVAFGQGMMRNHPPAARRPWWLPPGIECSLEELPKWHLLKDVLNEIEQEIHWISTDLTQSRNNTVLIMTNTERICSQLREFLSSMGSSSDDDHRPGKKMMERQLRNYFFWKGNLGHMNHNLQATPTDTSASAFNAHSSAGSGSDPASRGHFESEGLKRKEIWEKGRAPPSKRRRQRGGGLGGGSARKGDMRSAPEALEKEAGNLAQFIDGATQRSDQGFENAQTKDGHERYATDDDDLIDASGGALADSFTQVEFDSFFGLLNMEDLVVVRAYGGDDDDKSLQELRPRFIVMYDPEPSFVRRVEVYRSAHPDVSVRVYFLMYAESVEEQRYLSSLRREKESFERLIREKAMMALPIQADRRPAEQSSDERLLRTINSRLAGGQRTATSEAPRVIVDMREFRSSLPSMLHGAGLQVVPCTLQVGDYILTSTMCVERKSLSDLVQSFNSGRLYTQCELMSIHYKHPILLIEFDQDKSFSLQAMNESKGNPRAITSRTKPTEVDIQSKLVLLTTSFPRLRIIWSSSPYATSDIFAELKQNYEEPELSKVAAVGLDEAGSGAESNSENSFNLTPQDVLLALPGITTKNFRLVSNSVRDLSELCDLNLEEIQHLIGVEPGRRLYDFVNKNIKGRL